MKHKKLFFLALIFLSTLTGCNDQRGSAPQMKTSPSDVEVVDFSGETVRLKAPAKRVVALAPHIVENIFSAGAGETLVGAVAYSNYPESAISLPKVGGYAKTNIEKIVELKPDLVIAWESGNSQESITKIRELGLPVYIDQPDTLEDIARSIRDIGVLTGHAAESQSEAQKFSNQVQKLRKQFESKRMIPAFYQVWNSPLQTINGTHIISDAIQLCGGHNIYAEESVIAPVINIESILALNPKAIIASGMSSARPEWLDEWKKWPSLTAVKEDNLFFVDPDHIQRHTVRILLGIDSICTQLDIARTRDIP